MQELLAKFRKKENLNLASSKTRKKYLVLLCLEQIKPLDYKNLNSCVDTEIYKLLELVELF